MSEQLKQDLSNLGLQRYISAILNAGYNDWDAVAEMTESDFEALGILLGDRRKLQREIARRQLWPDGSPLPTPDELREFTLSRNEDNKNGVQHVYAQTEVSSPAHAVNLSVCVEVWQANIPEQITSYQDHDLGGGEGTIAQTPQSPNSILTLHLDSEMTDFENSTAPAEMNHSFLASDEAEFVDEITPRGVGDGVRPTPPEGNVDECALD